MKKLTQKDIEKELYTITGRGHVFYFEMVKEVICCAKLIFNSANELGFPCC